MYIIHAGSFSLPGHIQEDHDNFEVVVQKKKPLRSITENLFAGSYQERRNFGIAEVTRTLGLSVNSLWS